MRFYSVDVSKTSPMKWQSCNIQFDAETAAEDWVKEQIELRVKDTRLSFYPGVWTWKIKEVAVLDDGARLYTTVSIWNTPFPVTPGYLLN